MQIIMGKAVSNMLCSRNPEAEILLDDGMAEAYVLNFPEMKAYQAQFDPTYRDNKANWNQFWVYSGKPVKLFPGCTGGKAAWRKKYSDQLGQVSTRVVSALLFAL
jgi:hypothetical protein